MTFSINVQEVKKKFFSKENFINYIIIGVIFYLDRISKLSILNNFNDGAYYINDYINFDLIWNIGIGFGFFSTESYVFYNSITLVIALIIIFLLYIFIISNTLDKLIYAMILGGAIGNFYDRLIFKAVPDFIDIHYNNFHWFTFNVADIFITIGIIIFILRSFFVKDLK